MCLAPGPLVGKCGTSQGSQGQVQLALPLYPVGCFIELVGLSSLTATLVNAQLAKQLLQSSGRLNGIAELTTLEVKRTVHWCLHSLLQVQRGREATVGIAEMP